MGPEKEDPTPPGPPDPPTPPPPADPAPPHDDSELRGIVAELQAAVAQLSDTVAAIAPSPDDTSPVKRPWFARRIL